MIRYSLLLNPRANWEVATTPNKTVKFWGLRLRKYITLFITIVILCMLMMVLMLMMNE